MEEKSMYEKMMDIHDEMFSDETKMTVDGLSERWHLLGNQLWEDEFDVDEFKALVKETVPFIAEYANAVMPIEIANLLLEIKHFQGCPQINEDSGVAIHIAAYLCSLNMFLLSADCIDEEEDEETKEKRLFLTIGGNTERFDLYIDDLDFSDLKADLDL
jgi:hypothetical protein